jgi:hypothetical protein
LGQREKICQERARRTVFEKLNLRYRNSKYDKYHGQQDLCKKIFGLTTLEHTPFHAHSAHVGAAIAF